MVVGLREKKWDFIFYPLRKNFLPLIAGERIVSTWVLKKVTQHPLSRQWGLETYLNYYCNRHGIKITKVLLKGVDHLPKWKKGHGWKRLLYECFDLIRKYLFIYLFYFPYDLAKSFFSSSNKKVSGFKVKKVKIGDIFINFAQGGKGRKKLVLIHGWANNWEGWLPLAKFLKRNYTLYLVDLPGFGDSGDLKTYSISKAAKYVALFLKKQNIKADAVVGISMGSLVAAYLGKTNSQKIKNIILLGAIFKTGTKALVMKALKTALEIINGKKPAETLIKKFIETRMAAYLLAKYINMYKFNKFLVDTYGMIGKKKMRKEAFIQMGISAAKLRLEKILTNYPLPVLFIYGKDDKITSPAQAKKCLPKGHFYFVSIPQAGHVVAWEKPKEVARAIINFIEKGQV
jgi:pimeloyl-ACP methyl ester carboxylesterase